MTCWGAVQAGWCSRACCQDPSHTSESSKAEPNLDELCSSLGIATDAVSLVKWYSRVYWDGTWQGIQTWAKGKGREEQEGWQIPWLSSVKKRFSGYFQAISGHFRKPEKMSSQRKSSWTINQPCSGCVQGICSIIFCWNSGYVGFVLDYCQVALLGFICSGNLYDCAWAPHAVQSIGNN